MEQEVQKKEVALNNESYKERFQFILSLNENIICQRYFRINGFNNDSLESYELRETIDEIVGIIRQDLESKSRVYQWFTRNTPLKLTGFGKTCEEIIEKTSTTTYLEYPENAIDYYVDTERPKPYEYTFKFAFLMDNKPVYEEIWDGGDYPKYVRNSVDLTNSNHLYKDKDPMLLHFNVAVVRAMTIDKTDLIYTIIRKICDVTSSTYTEKYGVYTKKEKYGDKKYRFSLYNEEAVNDWRKATESKTKEYFNTMYPSQRQIERIDKYL